LIDRRRTLAYLAMLAAGPLAAQGRPAPATTRVGLLLSEPPAAQATRRDALVAGLADHGRVEGRNLELLLRSADGDYDRLPALARSLVDERVDVIVAFGIKALAAAAAATSTIPIVIPATSSDPQSLGLVGSHARPGRNVTGSSAFGPEIMAKRLELVRELKPKVARVAVLANVANASAGATVKRVVSAAQRQRIVAVASEVRTAAEIGPALASFASAGVEAVLVQDDTLFSGERAEAIARRGLELKLAVAGNKELADAGAVIGYGRTDEELYRRGAYFVDRILKGARPAELPVEQASRFDVVINARTARALGLRVPPSLLARADRVIE